MLGSFVVYLVVYKNEQNVFNKMAINDYNLVQEIHAISKINYITLNFSKHAAL